MTVAGSPAQATTTGTHIGNFSGNEECPEPGGQKTAVAALSGSFCLAKFGNGNANNGEQGTNTALDGINILDNFSLTGAGGNSGTFSFADQGEGFSITHLILKAGNGFSVFDLGGATSGSWMTAPHLAGGGGNGRAISHISFFGTTSTTTTIPVPAALPLFLTILAGFGLMGWRRRQTA